MVSTGGTIEKTYDELGGVLRNSLSNLDVVLSTLVLHGLELVRIPLMNKDSLEMTAADHALIAQTCEVYAAQHDGLVVVHGTDRLVTTGDAIVERIGTPRVPIVLTGAMRPYQLRNTDAIQNVTEALLAVQIASPGVYCALHNRLLRFPGVVKDRRNGTFARVEEIDALRNTSSAGTVESVLDELPENAPFSAGVAPRDIALREPSPYVDPLKRGHHDE